MASIGDTTRPEYIYDQATDTWIPVGIGPHSHTPAAIGAISSSVVTTKGDLIAGTGSGTVVRQGVGSDGQLLTADSSSATGLSYQNNFAAGKNKIINGDFYINQRAFTSSTSGGYGLDRWSAVVADGTVTYSVQTFTVGAAPVIGYEGKNFARLVTTGQTLSTAQARLFQAIEDVRTFANQTVTISFWAKAATGTPKMAIELNQDFGTGGSPSTAVANYAGQVTLSTSWVRYSLTLAIPSISGKTIGTTTPGGLFLQMWGSAGSSFNARTGSLGIQSNTFDIWGVQVESGSTATAFQTATGTIQGELAACQRYYFRHTAAAPTVRLGIYAISGTTTQANGYIQFPVPMRVAPTSMDTNTLKYSNYAGAGFNITSLAYNEASEVIAQIYGTISATTLATPGSITSQAVGSYLGFSAEL